MTKIKNKLTKEEKQKIHDDGWNAYVDRNAMNPYSSKNKEKANAWQEGYIKGYEENNKRSYR